MSEPLLTKLVIEEIKGRNAAIHAYDKMIWTVRSGYLTLFFGAWGLVLKALIDANQIGSRHRALVLTLLLVTVAIGLGAWAIDKNYVTRKFRVIAALNTLMDQIAKRSVIPAEVGLESLPELKVAGEPSSGPETGVGLLVYTVPLVALGLGLALFGRQGLW
jgi:hypothetical protein